MACRACGNAPDQVFSGIKKNATSTLADDLFTYGFEHTPGTSFMLVTSDLFQAVRQRTPALPFETKDINMSDYLNTARAENFMGRQWLYRDVENTFIDSDTFWGLDNGDPGAGKSALSSQLICSRTSSSVIHAHILAYHLFPTFNAHLFLIAFRIKILWVVLNKQFFDSLRNLKNKPKENWYIVIDALDECLARGETSHSIVYLLNNKIPRFPSWLKLIMTSRNESDAMLHSSKIKELIIDPEDSRNLKDIELFLTSRFYQGGPLLNRIRLWFGDDSVESTSKLVSALLSKSQGNFLFV
ncbi:Tetratricopeptide repeat, ankyrin repeat and coiled-coil containing [Desmophyllum pertusum]|uniref:Tetratricopeptide repeat, ankyrin repeat and coiled-coil containing n=1 Tax=Desmophyllum pertusum TaxID=174260 RepID=A0A9W9YZK2_9CNID|nr:Tetratricopeptide repeat, ankyrin repeat and coiled-coil containing [Desmophyllum pertusum]